MSEDKAVMALRYIEGLALADEGYRDLPTIAAAAREALADIDSKPATEQAEPVDRQAAFEAWLENYPIQVVEDDYEICFDAFMAGMKAAQPARSDFVPMPENENQAAGFALVGEAWLREHAPHRLKATQPARVPLTEEQIDDMIADANRGFCIERADYIKAVRDTERAHGIGEAGNG